MRGDTAALARLERESRRSDRSSRLIKKRLDKSKINQKRQGSVPLAAIPFFKSDCFSDSSSFSLTAATITSRRRLLRIQDGGKHAFYVGEIVSLFEEVAALIVACAHAKSDAQRISDTCMKEAGTRCVASDATVHLFGCDVDVNIGGEMYKHVCIKKLHLQDGQTLFWIVGKNEPPLNCPWELGLDGHCYRNIQSQAARLLSVRMP